MTMSYIRSLISTMRTLCHMRCRRREFSGRCSDGGTILYTLGLGDRLATYGRACSPSAPQPAEGTYTYDTVGNVMHIVRESGTTLDLTWNGQCQLVSVSTNGAFAESYTYDALGRRISTTTLEGTLRHVYDDNWQCIADVDENNNVVCSYVWGEGIDNLIAVKVGGNAYYPFTDIQGTVWGYADSENNIVARFDYDAWGNILSSVSTVPALARNRYRFQGREWSTVTGLTNFRMRWYDAETGRWLSKDPIGLSGGLNLYAFCGNDAMNRIDFDGRMSWGEVREIAGAAAEGFAEGFAKGLAATADGFIPFVDPFAGYYSNECGNLDDEIYRLSQSLDEFSRDTILPVAVARGAAAASSLKALRFLNQNRYLRIGKGNIPKGRPLTRGPGQKVPTLRIGNQKPTPYNHFDLRLWGY